MKSCKIINNYNIYKPINVIQSIELGRGTKWSISSVSLDQTKHNKFNSIFWYNDNDIYIITNDTEKYYIYVEQKNKRKIFDINENQISEANFNDRTNIPLYIFTYDKTQLNGEYILYDINKKIIGIRSVLHGKLNGRCIDFNHNGMIEKYVEYKNDKKDGIKIWYDMGEVIYLSHYKNDKLDGELYSYDVDGYMYEHKRYKDNKIIKDYMEDQKIKLYNMYA